MGGAGALAHRAATGQCRHVKGYTEALNAL